MGTNRLLDRARAYHKMDDFQVRTMTNLYKSVSHQANPDECRIRPPMLVFATKRGTELRFVNSRQMAANGTIIHRFLKEEMWRNLPVWQSRYGPGGDR